MVVDAGVERDAIKPSAMAREHNGSCVVSDNAWSGTEANAKDVDVTVDRAGRKRKSGVEYLLAGEQKVDGNVHGIGREC